MSWGWEIAFYLGLLLVLLMSGMWVPFAIGLGALVAMYMGGGLSSFNGLGMIAWGTMDGFTLSAIPLFILMAEVLSLSGISKTYYNGLTVLVKRLPGGLLQTNVAGCALFAAISGSSVATAASIGTVALPQLDARGYDPRMSCGSLAAGGTLGILIPPSLTMIIYGTITEVSIAKLFMAGVVPGLILAGCFMLYIAVRCYLQPQLAPKEAASTPLGELVTAFARLAPFLGLIFMVLGGIYAGITTPTEAAALGSALALVLCAAARCLTWQVLHAALVSTIKTSATLMFIILAAFIFSYAVEIAGIGEAMIEFVESLHLTRWEFLLTLIVIYGILGCLLDGAGMVVLTVPLFFPLLGHYEIDPVWFGVLLVLLVEFGMLTPPFGLNLFVVNSISGRGLGTVVKGCVPYYGIMLGFMLLLIVFPIIALWMPQRM